MKIRVECYAGRKAGERPVRFWVGDTHHMVEEILAQWYAPEGVFFKLRADDTNVYIVRHETAVADGGWELVWFREAQRG